MKIQKRYFPFVVFSLLALLAAMWAGLLRMGWSLPPYPNLANAHGPLMVCGFLGTLIPLERAVAIRKKWMFTAPALTATGWVFLLARPGFLGAILFTLGSLVTFAILLFMIIREPKTHTLVMAAGGFSWIVGNILWMMGMPIFQMVFFWMGFLVLTIAGERLELSRVLRPSTMQVGIFGLFVALILIGESAAILNLDIGTRLSGAGLLGLGSWFLANDIARRNLRHPAPLTRYIAHSLFAGFLWLIVGGGLMLAIGAQYAGPFYDAVLHIIFVGFVMSMIFGHAPIIFPAIFQVQINFQPAFYIHLILLHVSLLVRIIGDLASLQSVRQWGGLFNEVAILLFLGMTGYSIWKGLKR
ncbi:MAG: hypothetical protein A2X25_06950 [Chloroflexi bacterium GWB2_49_20]|nr:MAG: hypothetical protein A2X25_06950 [Chloroflexi bacterium GWB2_49_20]OGN77336.1 MAG: hypothetical protein A2X26_07665 [Chloroflexi bacterium GWC2_49_37]OGN84666.1 MAG: hypothetical protein A2X27_12885 [Chloroflexi bacterium GWD2_49_16]HBG74824.1 hypothetical protein [Anaerolineae bacterium]HCC77987.1 hypothetical protein [Anaerolineae bacterium]